MRTWWALGLAGALGAAAPGCGDDPMAAADADTTDVLFVPPDATSAATDTTAAPDTSVVATDTTTADTATTPTDTTTAATDTTTAPVPGDRCDNARALGDPDDDDHYDDVGGVGAASGLGDDYTAASCGRDDAQTNGAGQRDEVWRFVAATTGEHRVAVLADTSIDVVVYAFADGACGTTCLGFDDSGAVADIDQVTLPLTAGDVIYVVVDGKASAHAGPYLVDVYDCGGDCPP